MGKYKIAISSFKTQKNVTVIGRNTINKVNTFLQKALHVSYHTHPKDGGIEFCLFRDLINEKHELCN